MLFPANWYVKDYISDDNTLKRLCEISNIPILMNSLKYILQGGACGREIFRSSNIRNVVHISHILKILYCLKTREMMMYLPHLALYCRRPSFFYCYEINFSQVLFKKVIGDATYGQVAMFFSLIGLFNAAMLWPLSLTLYFTGVETLYWERLPWPALLAASILSLGIYFYIYMCFLFFEIFIKNCSIFSCQSTW